MGVLRRGLVGIAACALLSGIDPASAQAPPALPTPASPPAPTPGVPTPSQFEELTKEYDKLAESLSGLRQELQQLKADKVERAAAAPSPTPTPTPGPTPSPSPVQAGADLKKLKETLRPRLDRGELRLAEVRNRVLLTLPEKTLFRQGATAFLPKGREVLKDVAKALQELSSKEIQIGAHTDVARGPAGPAIGKKAFAFTTQRASLVVGALLDGGMPSQRLSAIGYGGTKPIAPNFTGAGRALNRRVEIVLVPSAD